MKMLPVLAAAFRRRKRPVGRSWRMDETYVKVGGHWKYLYGAVDSGGDTIDLLLRAKRDHAAARAFFERAIDLHDVPEKITIDKSGSNTAAIGSIQADSGLLIELCPQRPVLLAGFLTPIGVLVFFDLNAPTRQNPKTCFGF